MPEAAQRTTERHGKAGHLIARPVQSDGQSLCLGGQELLSNGEQHLEV